VWPLVALVVLRWRPDRLLRVAVGLACLSGAWRVTLVLTGASLERVQHGTDVRAESILIGCALAAWMRRGGRVRIHWAIPAAGLVAFLVTGGPSFHRWINTGWFTAVAVLTALLIGAWVTHAPATPAPLARFGKLTYGFYLWHVPVLWAFRDQPILWRLVGGFAVSLAAALASWRLVERRWLRDLHGTRHVELVGVGPGERGRVRDERRPGADVDPFDGGRRGHDTSRPAVVG
jgi:peptidoglycan/LPS O-acetylase OafA/YrhL